MKRDRITYAEPPVRLRWYRLDSVDVMAFQRFVTSYFDRLPDEFKQAFLTLYNDLNRPKNPRNTRLV